MSYYITLDHNMWGSDHKCSLEIHAMDILKKRIFSSQTAIGKPVKKVFEAEAPKIKSLKNIITKV